MDTLGTLIVSLGALLIVDLAMLNLGRPKPRRSIRRRQP
jgi:hypothetical protein